MSEQNDTRTIVLKVPVFRSRHISSTTYVVALLLFFLPFINIKCNDKAIASITGKDLVTGYDSKKALKNPFGISPREDRVSRSERSEKENASEGDEDIFAGDKGFKDVSKPSLLAIFSVVLCLIGIFFSFIKVKMAGLISAIAGAMSCLMLVVIFFDKRPRMAELDTGMGIGLSISFSFWFYLCVALLGIGAYFSYQVYREIGGEEEAKRMLEYASQFNYDPVNSDEPVKGE